MAIQVQGNNGVVAEVGGTTFRGLHTHVKPLEYGALGHYRSAVRFATAAAQAAGINLWEYRNTHATNLIVPTRLRLTWLQIGVVTTAARYDMEMRQATAFTASSTTNTVTPTVSRKRVTMAAAPGGIAIRHVTVAGAAAGMTGGTFTADGGASWFRDVWFLGAQPTAGVVVPNLDADLLDDVNGSHPFVHAQNEGLIIRPVIIGSATSFLTSINVDFSYADVTAY